MCNYYRTYDDWAIKPVSTWPTPVWSTEMKQQLTREEIEAAKRIARLIWYSVDIDGLWIEIMEEAEKKRPQHCIPGDMVPIVKSCDFTFALHPFPGRLFIGKE